MIRKAYILKALVRKALVSKSLIRKALLRKALIKKTLITKALMRKTLIKKALEKRVLLRNSLDARLSSTPWTPNKLPHGRNITGTRINYLQPIPEPLHYLVMGGSGSVGGRHLESRGYLRINYACEGDPAALTPVCVASSHRRGALLNQVAWGSRGPHCQHAEYIWLARVCFLWLALSIGLLTLLAPSPFRLSSSFNTTMTPFFLQLKDKHEEQLKKKNPCSYRVVLSIQQPWLFFYSSMRNTKNYSKKKIFSVRIEFFFQYYTFLFFYFYKGGN